MKRTPPTNESRHLADLCPLSMRHTLILLGTRTTWMSGLTQWRWTWKRSRECWVSIILLPHHSPPPPFSVTDLFSIEWCTQRDRILPDSSYHPWPSHLADVLSIVWAVGGRVRWPLPQNDDPPWLCLNEHVCRPSAFPTGLFHYPFLHIFFSVVSTI